MKDWILTGGFWGYEFKYETSELYFYQRETGEEESSIAALSYNDWAVLRGMMSNPCFWHADQEEEEGRKPAKRLRLETPDETIVSLDKSSFRSVVWQSHVSASGRMYFRASVKYNGLDHPKDFVLQCFNSECGVFRTILNIPSVTWEDQMCSEIERITPLFHTCRGWDIRKQGHRTISTHQPRTRKDMDTLRNTLRPKTALQHLALGGPPYPARGFTLTRH
ncbi:hypothetical protein L3Q82_023628 [Scortum barcoo]|uniref:Uncharacterized protein n=1 Tax=Scortum barcoo TaxID=214431 RepID=A0ACB8WT08_9TELE|nr:hypothetical protein L3Q82_023628 [Scortum barcoo]